MYKQAHANHWAIPERSPAPAGLPHRLPSPWGYASCPPCAPSARMKRSCRHVPSSLPFLHPLSAQEGTEHPALPNHLLLLLLLLGLAAAAPACLTAGALAVAGKVSPAAAGWASSQTGTSLPPACACAWCCCCCCCCCCCEGLSSAGEPRPPLPVCEGLSSAGEPRPPLPVLPCRLLRACIHAGRVAGLCCGYFWEQMHAPLRIARYIRPRRVPYGSQSCLVDVCEYVCVCARATH